MRVAVIDLKTGKSKLMPEKHAKVLVKLKRARWPEPTHTELAFPGTDDSRTIHDVDAEIKAANAAVVDADTPADTPATDDNVQNPEQQPAIIKRGRKPKFRG
jgi:hypothetical protein